MAITKNLIKSMLNQEKKNQPHPMPNLVPKHMEVIHPPEATPQEKMTPTSFAGIRKMMGKKY